MMGLWNAIKDEWNKVSPEQKKQAFVRAVKLAGALYVAGVLAGPPGVMMVVSGTCLYGAVKEYKERKIIGMVKAIAANKGRPLTAKQEKMARQKAFVDTFGLGNTGMMSAAMESMNYQPEDVKTAADKAKQKTSERRKNFIGSLGLGNVGLLSTALEDMKLENPDTKTKSGQKANTKAEQAGKNELTVNDFQKFIDNMKGRKL